MKKLLLLALLALPVISEAQQACFGSSCSGGSSAPTAAQIASALQCTDSVGTDAWACSPSACTAALDATTPHVLVTVGTANTGGATFAYCGLTAKAVVRAVSASVSTALATGDVLAGQKILLGYSVANDNWQMASPSAVAPSFTITSGTTATSGCVAGGVLRSISNLVECGAGLTYASGALTITADGPSTSSVNTNTAAVQRFRFYENATNVADFQFVGSNHGAVSERNWVEFVNRTANGGINFWTNSIDRMQIDSTGAVRIGNSSLGSTTVPLTARLGTGSTANVLEMQNSAGTVLSYFGASGKAYLPTVSNSCAAPSISFSGATTAGMSYDITNAAITFGKGGTCLAAIEASERLVTYRGFGWGTTQAATSDTILEREAAATLQMGTDVNGAAVNQTLKSHDGITGTDISGADFTIAAGRGTGTGAGGVLKFQTAPVEASGTTAQTLATRLTIQKDGGITLAGVAFANLGTPADGTLFYCSDCTIASPCADSGTGALAKRLNGTWVCN